MRYFIVEGPVKYRETTYMGFQEVLMPEYL